MAPFLFQTTLPTPIVSLCNWSQSPSHFKALALNKLSSEELPSVLQGF